MPKTIWLLILMLLLAGNQLTAGTTGKIAGKITDSETGEGLPGVNIQLEGTELGTTSDVDGVFIILNIPPGLYSIELSYIGYQSVRVKDVRVNVDFTTRVDQALSATVIAMDAVEVYGERNPLVRQDLTNTQVAVTSEQIETLPVDQIRDVIRLQAGIIEDNSGNLHIRGGRSNEIAYQVNGISINNPFGNSQGVGLATNAVEEVSVSAGTFSAEYGNALSGVINFVTKDGGSNYDFSLRGYTGDHVSSRDDIFFNIDDVDPLNNSRMEWTLSGPVPLFGDKLTFFTSGVWQKDDGHLYGMRLYDTDDLLFIDGDNIFVDPFGLQFSTDASGLISVSSNENEIGASGDREMVPMVTSEALNLTGKLTWKPTTSLKFSYDLIMDDGNRFNRVANGINQFRRYRFTPDGRPETVSRNISNSIGLTHTLTKTLFYTLKVGANFNEARTSVFEDPFDPRYIPIPNNDINTLIIPPTDTYVAGGTDLSHTTEKARTVGGKLDFVHQIVPQHELKYGAEVAVHRLELDNFTLLLDEQEGRFIIPSAEINSDFTNFQFYIREPVQAAFYALDKMELAKRFILNAGVRYEYLDTRAQYNPDLAGTVDDGVASEEFLEDAEPKHRISPRLSLSFPITEEGIIRFSYGVFYQTPTFRNIYRNPRFEDFEFTAVPSFGNPNLKPQRSIQYEMGLQQQFTDDIKMDLTVFYKDVNDLIEDRRVIAGEVAIDKEFNVVTNISYANVKGFTAAFLKRRSPGGLFSASLDYTFQDGQGAFTDPLDLAIDTRTDRESEQRFVPLSFDRTHTLNTTLTVHPAESWLFSAIGSIQGGTPYTPSVPSSVQAVEFEINSERRPLLSNVDLKLQKSFNIDAARMAVFLQVENLLDTINERFIHTNTGSSLTSLSETTNPNRFNNLRDTIEDDQNNFFPLEFLDNFYQREDWLGQPREIRLGLLFEL